MQSQVSTPTEAAKLDSLEFYRRLDRLPLLGGYSGKFFAIAFLGVHLPLIAGLVWLLWEGPVNWPLVGILVVATLVGTGLTLMGLHALLAPIRAATMALETYAKVGTLPRLPTRHPDLAGRLMAQTQNTLAELDSALTAARGGQQETMAQLERRVRAVAEVTHELRSPLTAVLGFAELLQMQSHGPLGHPLYSEFASDIEASGRHMLGLVEGIQRYASATGGRASLDLRPVPLQEAVERAVRLLRLEERRGVRIEVAVPKGLVAAADARALLQMLLNLLSNAVKYAGRGAVVRVSAAPVGDHLAVTVADSGAGMTGEELLVALEPYGRATRGAAKGEEGTGLGLPLTKALTELHGGSFAIESAPGRGTTVRFTLPRAT